MKKSRKMKREITTKVVIITLLVLLAADWFYLRQVQRQPALSERSLMVYNQEELAKYDGNDGDRPIYLALDGYVYDVSQGRENFYGSGKPYHDLVGKDASAQLHILGGSMIKRKYRVVGIYQP